MKRLFAAVAATAVLAALPAAAGASDNPDLYGFDEVSASLTTHQAGAHADFTSGFKITSDPESAVKDEPYGFLRDYKLELPPGLIANPHAVVPCTIAQFQAATVTSGCPLDSQVGSTEIDAHGLESFTEPVFMLPPPGGDSVARLGFWASFFPVYINIKLRSGTDYGLTAAVEGAAAPLPLSGVVTTFWGVPADPSHDPLRVSAKEAGECIGSDICSEGHPSGLAPTAFMTNPTSCGEDTELHFYTDSYERPNNVDKETLDLGSFTGCESLGYAPTFTVTPTTHEAGAPTGVDVELRQPPNEAANGLATSQLKDAVVTLPKGMTIASGVADGLQACSATQARYGKNETALCPEGAKVGSLELEVPALSGPVYGGIYQRDPEPGNLFRIWLIADGLGAHVKLPGQLHVDKQTGQVTSLFLDNPQVPFEILKLHFREGPRAALDNPPTCGTHFTHYEFTPWSGNPDVSGDTPMTIDQGCGTGGFDPKLSAGTTNPNAGQFSPFVFTLTRQDGEQNPAALDIALPQGLAAAFKGIARCEGVAAESGACPAGSRVGHVIAATGAGSNPLWVPQAGKRPTAVYLGGPYKGAPLSFIAVVPAQAGPFDFGDQVVRSAVYVDPRTAQASIKSDPLPQIIEGIPLSYRTIHVAVDRPGFTLNPTSCAQKQTEATLTSAQGAVAHPSSPFAAVNCARLGFKPRLGLKLLGGTRRGGHPALRATFRPREGDANAKSIVARLPRSAFLDQAHIRTICTRVQYAAGARHGSQCPAGSIYGHATAYSPLFDEPLEGPVFLRSSSHNLPDLVMALRGPASLPLEIEAVGRIDSVGGGIRSSFEAIPDAPLSKVVLSMQGGKKGLIVNSRNLCAGKSRADVGFTGHNGKQHSINPVMRADCGKHAKKHGSRNRAKR